MTGFEDSLGGGNLMEGRHKQNSLHLSLNKACKRIRRVSEFYQGGVLQTCYPVLCSDNCTQNIFYCCRIAIMNLLFIQETLHDLNTNTPKTLLQDDKAGCFLHTMMCPSEQWSRGRSCYPLLPSKKMCALGEHWSSTRYELQGWTQRWMSLRVRKQTLIVSK